MSPDLQEPRQDVPTYGVRNSSGMADAIHRDDDSDDHRPACREGAMDRGEFIDVHIPSHLPFSRWHLCRNPKCFGEDDEDDVDRGESIETDGGRPAEHYLDEAADLLEVALEKEDNEWTREAIGELRADLARLQGFEIAEDGDRR